MVFILYAVSAVFTFVKLPDGIVLSSDITSETAVRVPTLGYLTILTVFLLEFMWPFLTRQRASSIANIDGTPLLLRLGRIRITNIIGTAVLLLFHWSFVSANIGG
jgi:hypothetical protein